MEQPSPTLFVADIPKTLQEPEFVSLFSSMDGFQSARLRQDKNENVVGFVDFVDRNTAARAKDRLQGYKFLQDSERGITIHFSHGGTRTKRSREQDEDRDPYSQSRASSSNVPMMVQDFSSFYSAFPGVFPSYSGMPGGGQPGMQGYPPLPLESSSTLYVEGLPMDATEREVAHIFRPFSGFQSLRVLQKESKTNPTRTYKLCFVEFDNKYQATVAMHSVQGYKMDKNDLKGINITYARTERKRKGEGEKPNGAEIVQ